MINDPIGIVALLLIVEGAVMYFSDHHRTRKLFSFIPPMFWIYFLPLLATTFHVLPQKSEVYQFISKHFLPASLVLLLISVDIKAVLKLGKNALIMLFVGSAGIVVGGPIVLLLFKHWLPENIWSGFGALSASWIGGSANMIAVKEAIGTPDSLFFPMVVVDTIVAYTWMGIVILLSGYQARYDRWNRSRTEIIDELNTRMLLSEKTEEKPLQLKHVVMIFGTAIAGSWIASCIAQYLPEVHNIISKYTWTIIIVSLIGIIFSFTRVKKLEMYGSSKIGYALLYFVLASIGARASLSALSSAPVLIVAGFLWVGIHALFLFIVSRLLKTPLFLAATASQANIGGPVSAPVVAALYQPSLAPVGLLMAIVGNIAGLYLGILCAHLCKLAGS